MLKISFYAVYRWLAQARRRWVNKASDTSVRRFSCVESSIFAGDCASRFRYCRLLFLLRFRWHCWGVEAVGRGCVGFVDFASRRWRVECVQSGRWAVDCDRVGCVHDCGDGTRHDRRSAARACWRRSAGGRRDCVDGRSAGILGRMGRGADDPVRRGDRGIPAQSKAESNLTALIDAAPRTAHVVSAARHAGACARVGQRAYGRRDRRRISYCQSVRILEKRTTKTVKSVLCV